MPAGLQHPADSLNQILAGLGTPTDSVRKASALKAASCRRLFEEAASGGRWDLPELHRMLDQLREGDTVVVWKLDRLSRSLKDVLHIMGKRSGGDTWRHVAPV